jgi:hypothetical protein
MIGVTMVSPPASVSRAGKIGRRWSLNLADRIGALAAGLGAMSERRRRRERKEREERDHTEKRRNEEQNREDNHSSSLFFLRCSDALCETVLSVISARSSGTRLPREPSGDRGRDLRCLAVDRRLTRNMSGQRFLR